MPIRCYHSRKNVYLNLVVDKHAFPQIQKNKSNMPFLWRNAKERFQKYGMQITHSLWWMYTSRSAQFKPLVVEGICCHGYMSHNATRLAGWHQTAHFVRRTNECVKPFSNLSKGKAITLCNSQNKTKFLDPNETGAQQMEAYVNYIYVARRWHRTCDTHFGVPFGPMSPWVSELNFSFHYSHVICFWPPCSGKKTATFRHMT